MPDKKYTRLAEWMSWHRFTASKLAEQSGVSRQTIAKIAAGDTDNIVIGKISQLIAATGLTFADLCTKEESPTYRRTGNAVVDKLIPNMLRDLHQPNFKSRYGRYIDKRFECTSPHYFKPLPSTSGEWAMPTGDSVPYRKGYVTWDEMCELNQPETHEIDELSQLDNVDYFARFITVESMDTLGPYTHRKTAKKILVLTKSVWHVERHLLRRPLTTLILDFEHPVMSHTDDIPPRIVNWWWIEVPHA